MAFPEEVLASLNRSSNSFALASSFRACSSAFCTGCRASYSSSWLVTRVSLSLSLESWPCSVSIRRFSKASRASPRYADAFLSSLLASSRVLFASWVRFFTFSTVLITLELLLASFSASASLALLTAFSVWLFRSLSLSSKFWILARKASKALLWLRTGTEKPSIFNKRALALFNSASASVLLGEKSCCCISSRNACASCSAVSLCGPVPPSRLKASVPTSLTIWRAPVTVFFTSSSTSRAVTRTASPSCGTCWPDSTK